MHGIEKFDDGSAAFYSARVPAWHRLGTVTEEAKTAREALEIAQLDWEVRNAPLFAHDGDVMVKVEGWQAVVRTHRKKGQVEALGVVGMRYVPVQNADAFSLLTDIVADSDLRFDTAGSIFGGKRIFVTARIPQGIVVEGFDNSDLYLLATNNHDGRGSLRFAVTPVRVVCQNTLVLGLKEAPRIFRAHHTGEPMDRIVTNARDALGLISSYSKALTTAAERLLSTPMSEREFRSFADRFLSKRKLKADTRTQYVNQLCDVWNGPNQSNIAATRWAAYNSVVEWLDWSSPARRSRGSSRSAGGSQVVRAEKIIAGTTEAEKQRAYALLTQ